MTALAALRARTHPLMVLGVPAALLSIVYAPVFAALVEAWWVDDVYRHGFLVPFISGYLAWRRRDLLVGLTLQPAAGVGLGLMAGAGALLVAGRHASVLIVQELSLLPMLAGLVIALAGWTWLRALWLPLAYLFFMIPVATVGTDWVHWPFQLLAANIGVAMLQALGFPAFRREQFIDLPLATLEVAEGCSGIRLLTSVVAIGIPLAYLTQRTWARGVGLVTLAVVIGVLANGVRVFGIGLFTYYGGDVSKGPFEFLQAMFVAWVGYIVLFVGAWALNREPAR